jgi:glucokinase
LRLENITFRPNHSTTHMYLGIEIGGTKLQLGVGPGDGTIVGLWRGDVNPAAGAEGICRQIQAAVPELLRSTRIGPGRLKAVGVGFGGPVDDQTQRIIKSHQIAGWDDFPLAQWLRDALHIPAFLGNDADVAGLSEALHGAGQGLSPVFYITIGSGIGGGFIIDGDIHRGTGRGAAEIGHLRIFDQRKGAELAIRPLEEIASGWGIGSYARRLLSQGDGHDSLLLKVTGGDLEKVSAKQIGEAAERGDSFALVVLQACLGALSEAICSVITLLCPRRIVIGGGVSLLGETFFFQPLREMVAQRVFAPFAGLTEIVPAALGEAVVVHGALALAKRRVEG